jgi:hypothetical protein
MITIKSLVFLLSIQIMSLSLKAQKIDSLKIICRDLLGESRGVVTNEMLLKRWNNKNNTMCTRTISDIHLINEFYITLKKTEKLKSSGVICNALIIMYSNGIEEESICTDNHILYRGNSKSYNAKEIVLLLNLKDICNSDCDRYIRP